MRAATKISQQCARKGCFRSLRRSLSSQPAYDYIVVGSGSAGAALARKLGDGCPDSKVLLLEAGKKRDWYPWFHIPVGYLYTIDNPKADWLFRTAPEAGLNGRSLLYPRGLGLGGCTLINGMIYMRGQAADYEEWAQLLEDPAWGWTSMLGMMKEQEGYYGQSSDLHGTGGPWTVEKIRSDWEILRAWVDAADKFGIPRTTDFNTGNNHGVGFFDVNQKKNGLRLSSVDAFLGKCRPSNVDVRAASLVDKLLLSDDASSCLGVSLAGGERLMAKKEVVLSAGAIGSVQILERSGVGKGEVLEKAGVSVTKELPGVGENLQDHLQLRLVFGVENVTSLNTQASSIIGQAKIALQYVTSGTGPMASAPSQLGAFVKSSDAESRPNLQYHIQPLSLPAFGQDLDSFDAFTVSVCDLRPTSRGSVHISSNDVATAPKIAPNYLSTKRDKDVAVKSIQQARDIVSMMDGKYNPVEVRPGANLKSFDELIRAAGDIGTTIFHPAGTTKMGLKSDPMAVVDSRLRVHGISNLRIADCGIMPTIISGNTSAPTIAIGGMCARMIAEDNTA